MSWIWSFSWTVAAESALRSSATRTALRFSGATEDLEAVASRRGWIRLPQRPVCFIGVDRPGYGLSTPTPGRTISSVVTDMLGVVAFCSMTDMSWLPGWATMSAGEIGCLTSSSTAVSMSVPWCEVSGLSRPAVGGEVGFESSRDLVFGEFVGDDVDDGVAREVTCYAGHWTMLLGLVAVGSLSSRVGSVTTGRVVVEHHLHSAIFPCAHCGGIEPASISSLVVDLCRARIGPRSCRR